MTIWDGGFRDQPEDELEAEWRDSDGEDEPGQWLPQAGDEDWRLGPMSPEEQMYRKMLEDDDTDPEQ